MMERFNAIVVSIFIFFLVGHTQGEEEKDLLHLLEARDMSIVSFEIKLRRVDFDVELNNQAAIKRTVEAAAERDDVNEAEARIWAEELVTTWSRNPSWVAEHVRQRGDCFKEIQLWGQEKLLHISVYDGGLHYDYFQPNQQLDIYSKTANVHRANLWELGLAAHALWRRPKRVSVEWHTKGIRCTVSQSGDRSPGVTYEYDPHLGLRHTWSKSSSSVSSDHYYLFHNDVAGHSVPRVRVDIDRHRHRTGCTVDVYVIEDVRINCSLVDEDLCLGDLPDRTLVIDRRFGTSQQWRWDQYCQGAANPENVHAGQVASQDFVGFLDRTSGPRKAQAVRDTRIGRQAPPLHVEGWLMEIPALDNWPPKEFTVLNFCGIGCGFCLREFPQNKALAQWLTDQGARFLAIHTVRGNPVPVTEVLDRNHVRYPVGLDKPSDQSASWGSATFAEYGISGIPAYVSIARDGRILSYDRTLTKERLRHLMSSDPKKVVAQNADTPAAVMPQAWRARHLKPQTPIEGRFFVFRPETPDFTLLRFEAPGNAVACRWTVHRTDSQAPYQVRLTAQAPDWGQTLRGNVTLVAQYDDREEPVTIPYELHSEALTECLSPIVWFGCVEPGAVVTRRLPLDICCGRDINIRSVSLPPELAIRPNDAAAGTSFPHLSFSSTTPGLRQGKLVLSARDTRGHRQSIELTYCALVR